jgi:polygalacturonase
MNTSTYGTKISVLIVLSFVSAYSILAQPVSWSTMDETLARISPPTFPAKDFIVTSYGAVGDGKFDCTDAIAKTISACAESGGGRVVVPEGVFLTGAIHLKSNVNLHVTKNAVVRFSTDPKKYLPLVFTRWEGVEVMNYSPLIYAFEQENIAVTGEGILDGQGSNEHWWPWKGKKDDGGWKQGMPHQKKGRDSLFLLAEMNVPVEQRVFGEGYYLRPSFFQPYRSKNIMVSGVTFKNSPMWFLNPVLCENVTINGVTVQGLGPNNDGCNPESSKDVLIANCYFDTGDDCIAIKSGRNNDGRRINVPSENIVIRNCKMKEGHGGVVLGSELSGGIRNVFVEDCTMDSPNLDRALRFKTNSVRGGVIENFFARRITVGQVAEAVVLVDYNYEEGDAGSFDPVMRNVYISDVTAKKGKYALFIKGYARAPIINLHLENCRFDAMEKENVVEHVKGLTLNNVTINGNLVRNK